MISASRSARRFAPAKRLAISCFHSSMFYSRDSADCSGKLLPFPALQSQNSLSFGGQAVVAPPSLVWFFDPTPENPAALLEPVQQGIQRSDVKMKRAP